MKERDIQIGDEIYFAGSFYQVADIKDFPHGRMIGIYDEPPTKHIDYINQDSVKISYPCNCCQGAGCPVCGGLGRRV